MSIHRCEIEATVLDGLTVIGFHDAKPRALLEERRKTVRVLMYASMKDDGDSCR
jgi:hypothetical protein